MDINKDWRGMLKEIGGWENSMVSVNAGAVREIIEEVESLRQAIRLYYKEGAWVDGDPASELLFRAAGIPE